MNYAPSIVMNYWWNHFSLTYWTECQGQALCFLHWCAECRIVSFWSLHLCARFFQTSLLLLPTRDGGRCKRSSLLRVQGLTAIKSLLCLALAFKWGCETELAPSWIFPSTLHRYLGFLMTCPFLCSWWSTLAMEEHYHSYFITVDSMRFFHHLKPLFGWSLGKLLGYCELWGSFLLLLADKSAFPWS